MHISQMSLGYSTRRKSLYLHKMCCPWDAAEVTADVPYVSTQQTLGPRTPALLWLRSALRALRFPSCVTLKTGEVAEQLNVTNQLKSLTASLFLSFFLFLIIILVLLLLMYYRPSIRNPKVRLESLQNSMNK